jgi:hypothetical protein
MRQCKGTEKMWGDNEKYSVLQKQMKKKISGQSDATEKSRAMCIAFRDGKNSQK